MIRTLQDHGIHMGIDVHMECTILDLLTDAGRIAGAFGYDRERGRFKCYKARAVVLATGGIGRAYKITATVGSTPATDSRSPTAGAALMDMEFVQFHPPAWFGRPACAASSSPKASARRRCPAQQPGQALHVRRHPGQLQIADRDTPEEGWRYVTGDKNARRPPELLTRDHVARCIVREVREGAAARTAAFFSTSRGSRKNSQRARAY